MDFDSALLEELAGEAKKSSEWVNTKSFKRRLNKSEEAKRHSQSMNHLKERDALQRIEWRPVTATFFFIMLGAQNIVVWRFVVHSMELGLDKSILGILISGTLAETYLVVKLIVEFLFKEIDFVPNQGSNPEE